MNYRDISSEESQEDEIIESQGESFEEGAEEVIQDLEQVNDKEETWAKGKPRGKLNKSWLTDDEEKFAENILAGMSATDAAREISDAKFPAQYWHQMKNKAHIMAYIQEKGREMFDIQVGMARSERTPPAVRATVIKDILDRAGIKPEEEKQEFEATVGDITIKILS